MCLRLGEEFLQDWAGMREVIKETLLSGTEWFARGVSEGGLVGDGKAWQSLGQLLPVH